MKEIATEQLFTIEERVPNGNEEVSGQDLWRITSLVANRRDGTSIVLARQALSEKFFAEVDG